MTRKTPFETRQSLLRPAARVSEPIRKVGVAMAIGALCMGLVGCMSDSGAPSIKTSPDAHEGSTLRYYGGPKSPMWPDR